MVFPFSHIQELLKLSPSKLVGAVISLILFFCIPEQWLQNMRILEFKQKYSYIFSIALLVSVVLLIMQICQIVGRRIQRQVREWEIRNEIMQKLQLITEDEKQILRYYIFKQTRTNYLDIRNGAVNGLVAANIIRRSSEVSMNVGFNNMIFAFRISDIAWQILNENTEFIFNEESRFFHTDFDHVGQNVENTFF